MKNKLEELDNIIAIQEQSTTPDEIYHTGLLNGLLLAKSIITGCEFHRHNCTPEDSENAVNKWYEFDIKKLNKQKLPQKGKWVLVKRENRKQILAGYLRFAAGDKTSPEFITPASIIISPERILEFPISPNCWWCDCLPPFFEVLKLPNEE